MLELELPRPVTWLVMAVIVVVGYFIVGTVLTRM